MMRSDKDYVGRRAMEMEVQRRRKRGTPVISDIKEKGR